MDDPADFCSLNQVGDFSRGVGEVELFGGLITQKKETPRCRVINAPIWVARDQNELICRNLGCWYQTRLCQRGFCSFSLGCYFDVSGGKTGERERVRGTQNHTDNEGTSWPDSTGSSLQNQPIMTWFCCCPSSGTVSYVSRPKWPQQHTLESRGYCITGQLHKWKLPRQQSPFPHQIDLPAYAFPKRLDQIQDIWKPAAY